MGIDASIENERGETVEALPDPKNILLRLILNLENNNAVGLKRIDPYADTTFDQLQMPVLIRDLENLIAKSPDKALQEHGSKLLSLAKKYSDRPGCCLKFYGD